MLKITTLLNELAPSRNINSKPASKKNNSNRKVNRFGIGRNSMEYAKKSEKLFKSGRSSKSRISKSKKIFKFQNLAKSGKKLSKNGNSTNFDTTEAKPKFLTLNARIAFNCLRLAFTEAPILWHFDSEYHIWIETDALSYTIDSMLNQLTSKTNPKNVVIKINFG